MNEEQKLFAPPHDMEAEQALLGSILLNAETLDDVADVINDACFYDPRHQLVFAAMLKLSAQSKPIDIVFVLEHLNTTQEEETGIDKEFLLHLVSKNSLIRSPAQTAKIIKEKYLLRTLVRVGDQIKSMAVDPKHPASEVLDLAQKELYEVSIDNIDKNFIALPDVLTDTFDRINDLYTNKTEMRGIPTGFHDIDDILGGLHKSDLLILAARPSMGKTSFTLEMVKRIALEQKQGVAFFSLEMSRDQLADKLIASVSGLDLYKIRTGHLSEDPHNNEFMRLGEAIGRLSEAPIWIDDSGYLNILELRTKARRLKSRHNIGAIFIDYLQLMSGNGNYGSNRVQEVSDISRGLKMLAKELDIPVIALSQLSRSVEGRDDKRPMLSDLRESGSIEQDADIVMFIHREEMYHKDTKKKGIADILISKHRNGQTGSVELAWIHRLASFDNLQGARVSGRVNE